MATINRTAAFWCAQGLALCIGTIGVILLDANRDWAAEAKHLRATSTPRLYTVVDLGKRDRYGRYSSISVEDAMQHSFSVSLNGSSTRVHKVGSQILARGSDHSGTLMPEDVVQAGWWHWYGFASITLTAAVSLMAYGFSLLRRPRKPAPAA